MPKALESFMIARSAEGYVLQIEDEDGTSLELEVDDDQLELIADEIERHLDEDDDEIDDDGENEEEPDAAMHS